MKRILSVALVCVLVAAMCVTVMATSSPSNYYTAPAFVTIVPGNASADADADDTTSSEVVDIDEPEEPTDTDEEPDSLGVDDNTADTADTSDSNPTTGVVLALVPMAVAAAAVVASKRR